MVSGSDRTTKMTPKQIEVTAPEWREACAPATLPKWKIKITEKIEACYGASNAGSSTAFDTLTLAAGASYAVAQETIRNTVAEYNWCRHDCSVMLAASLRPVRLCE
jgi:hypothetical protein